MKKCEISKYCIRRIQEFITDIEELKDNNYHIAADKKYNELVYFLRGVETALFDKGLTFSAYKHVDGKNKSRVFAMVERYKDPEKWCMGKEIVCIIDSDYIFSGNELKDLEVEENGM